MTLKSSFKERVAFGCKLGLGQEHAEALAALKSPEDVQDFISTRLSMNFEPQGDTCMSVARTLEAGHGHCIESAFVAACALWMGGRLPLLVDMQAEGDDDHVIVVFRRRGFWGAISKSNHVWLRWRDPVYRSLRELAMSYFHEYVSDPHKTLRRYSVPFDLRRQDPAVWVAGREECWDIAVDLDRSRHYSLITPSQARGLRPRDEMEQKADSLIEYKNKSNNKRKGTH